MLNDLFVDSLFDCILPLEPFFFNELCLGCARGLARLFSLFCMTDSSNGRLIDASLEE